MKTIEFYQCNGCETILLALPGRAPHCCSPELKLLAVNSTEGSTEKHSPVLSYDSETLLVKVASAPHITIPEHYIYWIFVQTSKGGQYVNLTAGDAPEARFTVKKCDVLDVYAYCNVHGLWRADIEPEEFEETVCSAEFSQGCIGLEDEDK